MKAILLVRVSTEVQELEEQANNLKQFAITKGYKEKNLILIEEKESAIKLKEYERNGLNRMKEYISNDKEINAVFVWELSRLTRIPKTAYDLRDYFLENQVQLHCYQPNFQLLNDELTKFNKDGGLTFALYIHMAEAEMATKKERFHRSKVRNARTGKYSGGFIKFGYKLDDKGFYVIDEDKAPLVRHIFNEYEKGKSIFKLSKELHERGKINTQNFVRGILISECYTGFSNQYNMERQYPQIISKEQFEKCREIAKENNKKADKANETYYCKGLIKCSECGTHYIGMKASISYLCYGRYGKEARFDKSKACKQAPIININLLDSIVWEIAKDEEFHNGENSKDVQLKEINEKLTINNEKIEEFKKKLVKIEPRKKRNNTMYDAGQMDEDEYLAKAKVINNEVSVFKNTILRLQNENEVNERIKNKLIDNSGSKELIDILNDEYDNISDISDDEKRQEICRRWIKEINIIEDVPNKSKLILVKLKTGNEILCRAQLCKKPPIVESCYIEPHGFIEPFWRTFEYEYLQRFTRKTKNKAETPLEN